MKKEFSKSWKGSVQPRKQRKFRYNATLGIRHSFVSCHLSKELRKTYSNRSIPVHKADKVKILRGDFKGKIGKVEKVDLKTGTVTIEGIEIIKKDGSKVLRRIQPSNLIIIELNLDDKKRQKTLRKIKEK
jgi:large subunit ribosomal protein L24